MSALVELAIVAAFIAPTAAYAVVGWWAWFAVLALVAAAGLVFATRNTKQTEGTP